MFQDWEKENLVTLAGNLRQLAGQIERIAELPSGEEALTREIMFDVAAVLQGARWTILNINGRIEVPA